MLAGMPTTGTPFSTNLLATNGWVALTNRPVLANGWHVVTLGVTNEALFFRLRKP